MNIIQKYWNRMTSKKKLTPEERIAINDYVNEAFELCLKITDFGLTPSKRAEGGWGYASEADWGQDLKPILERLEVTRGYPRLSVAWAQRQTYSVTLTRGKSIIAGAIIKILEGDEPDA